MAMKTKFTQADIHCLIDDVIPHELSIRNRTIWRWIRDCRVMRPMHAFMGCECAML